MRIFKIILWTVILFWVTSCRSDSQGGDREIGVEEMTTGALPEMSVYQLPGIWTDQDSTDLSLDELRGKVTVMVMIYTTCQAACPRLVADMRRIAEDVPDDIGDQVQYVFLSIDPETDTPHRMKEFAAENQMTDEKWIFLRSTEETTREFATVLAVNYKRISPMDFSHSNIISVFDKQGVMQYQQEGLDKNHRKTVQTIIDLAG